MSKAELRRRYQLQFLESKEEIEAGDPADLPINLAELLKIDRSSGYVEQYFGSGLTADVYKLNIDGKCWTLKKKRKDILVRNVDGQTSFLNEVQRRRDFETLKAGNDSAYRGIIDTTYASLKNGIILSPWIEGSSIKRYSGELMEDLFNTLYYVEIAGLFEWDLCSVNILVQSDGKVRLFDFGYMYPFNPLNEYNSDGKSQPIFHSVERFETRNYMQYLMDIEDEIGLADALNEYMIEKAEALKYYLRKREWLNMNQADDDVIDWIGNIIRMWDDALQDQSKLRELYDVESFRSYVLDIHDDIGGKSCTPDTLRKIDKVLLKIQNSYEYLKANQGLFWGDEDYTQKQLLMKYSKMKDAVKRYQIENLDGFMNLRRNRLESIRAAFNGS